MATPKNLTPKNPVVVTSATRFIFPVTLTTPGIFAVISITIFLLVSIFACTSSVPEVIDAPAVFIRAALLDSTDVHSATENSPSQKSVSAVAAESVHAVANNESGFFFLQRVLFILIASTGLALFIFTVLLRVQARSFAMGSSQDGFDAVNRLPALGIVEVTTFVWVLSSLALAVYYILTTFADNKDMIFNLETIESNALKSQTTTLLFFLSFVCGLLGGALSNLKFFLTSGKPAKRFDFRYLYRYLANPFFSSVIGFFAFLIMVNLNVIKPEEAAKLSAVSFIFVFVLVGYFSETFVALLSYLVKRTRLLFESKFDAALDQIADDGGKANA